MPTIYSTLSARSIGLFSSCHVLPGLVTFVCGLLCLFQLGIALDKLLQTEARELYRKLGIFPISFALIHRSFPVFRVLDLLTGAESAPACGSFRLQFRNGKLLPARGEEFCNIVDRVVVSQRRRRLRLYPGWIPTRALVFVFVGVMRAFAALRCGTSSRWGEGARPHIRACSHTTCASPRPA